MRFFAQTDTKSIWDNLVLDEWRIPFGDWVDQTVDWIDNRLEPLLQAINWPFETLIDLIVNDFLLQISWVWVVLGMALIASVTRNVKVGAFVAIALTICGILGNAYWIETARTIGFIGVAVILCVIIGLPIGILAGRVDGIWQVTRPVLDAMQVVHSFVYMLPFIFFWGIGEVSATMVTMVFALPPLIRLTNLGIRQVPEDVVEAARAFGAPERRVLTDVQLPLARPAIMTGINQTLLLAISMLGIAAIMGAGGLGRLLFRSLSNQDVALAASAGLAFFLVAVVLDRMSQRDGDGGGNLFIRIRRAWATRREPELLLEDSGSTDSDSAQTSGRIVPLASSETTPIALVGLGGVLAVVSVFLEWTNGAGKISAYGSRADEDLTGLSFNGLQASGGSWYGILVVAMGLFLVATAAIAYIRAGRGPRWMTVDGGAIAAMTLLASAAGFMLAQPSALAMDPGTGIGVILAAVGGVVAVAGSMLWLRVAPHTPDHPLPSGISAGRLVAVAIALLVVVGGAFGGWSFDDRSDVVITPEIQAEIDALRAQANEDPTQAAVVGNQISVLIASAQATSTIITDGVSSDGPRLGIWTVLLAIIGTATALPASGVFGSNERTLWFWSTITAGMGSGIIAISFGWIFTLVRNADPNYVSGVGAFMALSGGFYLLASTMPILKEFRRSKEYDDVPLEGAPADVPAQEPVHQTA